MARTKVGWFAKVSTVWLVIDHSWTSWATVNPEQDLPLSKRFVAWETLVFGGLLDQEQDRCSGFRADAWTMHREMCHKVREAQRNPFWVLKRYPALWWGKRREWWRLYRILDEVVCSLLAGGGTFVSAPDLDRMTLSRYYRIYQFLNWVGFDWAGWGRK